MKISEKSEKSPRDWSPLIACAALFLVALIARVVGIGWGLPSPTRWSSYHPDELQTVASVLSLDFFNGDFNPNFFNYPSLYLYLAYVAHTLAAGLGWTQPISNANIAWALPHDIILCARVVSALLGALTVPLVFLAAREIAGFRVALLAGILMALAPGHVQHSHFATVDVPATFFVALSLWLATRALGFSPSHEYSCGGIAFQNANRKRRADLLWSAFAAGLAAATKYNAVLVLIAPLCAAWIVTRSANATNAGVASRDQKTEAPNSGKSAAKAKQNKTAPSRDSPSAPRNEKVTMAPLRFATLFPSLVATAIGGFVLGCPFSVLSWGEFWGDGLRGGVNGFAYELLVHPRGGSGEIFQNTGNGWWYHLAFNLPFAMSAPVVCASLLGLGAWLSKAFSSAKHARAAVESYGAANASDAANISSDAANTNERAAWPCVAFVLLSIFALGWSQVRFLRYTLPLLPALCVFAAWGARFLAHQLTIRFAPRDNAKRDNAKRDNAKRTGAASLIFGAALSVLVLVATLDVLWPLTHVDPRDQAAAYMSTYMSTHAAGTAPISVGLADASFPLWFYTPPLWPQSAPPGGSVSTIQALRSSRRYTLAFTGLDAAQLKAAKPAWFLINEFQWRDKERLHDAGYARFSQALDEEYDLRSFRNRSPFALPGRAFAPYDFLYTNPEQRVYKRRD